MACKAAPHFHRQILVLPLPAFTAVPILTDTIRVLPHPAWRQARRQTYTHVRNNRTPPQRANYSSLSLGRRNRTARGVGVGWWEEWVEEARPAPPSPNTGLLLVCGSESMRTRGPRTSVAHSQKHGMACRRKANHVLSTRILKAALDHKLYCLPATIITATQNEITHPPTPIIILF